MTPSVTFAAVGDISLGDHPLCVGFGTHSRLQRHSPDYALELVAPVLRQADVTFGNCECTLSEVGLQRGRYSSVQMRGQPSYAPALRQCGFKILNVANNHSQQHGPEAFRDSLALLRAQGIEVCGLRPPGGRGAQPVVMTRNGLILTLVGYSLRPRQYFTEVPLYAEGRRDEILADVKLAGKSSDVTIASLHWGDEFVDHPSPDEVALAHDIIDAGANLIIGHHPHVLRGIEEYGKGCIAYSLGNFVCDMLWDERMRESAILRCALSKSGVSDVSVVPVKVGDDYRPVPMSGGADRELLARVHALSEALQAGHPGARGRAESYQDLALAALQGERSKAHRYFLRNAYRYPPRIVLQQVARFVRNRLSERVPFSKASQP